MNNIYSYRDLDAWKKARLLVRRVYDITQSFPKAETYGLMNQMRRAAVSIPSNIAEGHSRRGTRDYMQFVSVSIGSLAELDTQLYLAEDLQYLTDIQAQTVRSEIVTLQKILHGLRTSLYRKISA